MSTATIDLAESAELLRAADIARVLKVRRRTVWGWHRSGLIPSHRLGPRCLRFILADVIAALEASGAAGQ
jgi:predicted DNA-binding transcriptional regulator AlpA